MRLGWYKEIQPTGNPACLVYGHFPRLKSEWHQILRFGKERITHPNSWFASGSSIIQLPLNSQLFCPCEQCLSSIHNIVYKHWQGILNDFTVQFHDQNFASTGITMGGKSYSWSFQLTIWHLRSSVPFSCCSLEVTTQDKLTFAALGMRWSMIL